MRIKDLRPSSRWGVVAVAGTMSAALAAPMSLGTAAAGTTPAERPVLRVSDVRTGVISLQAVTNPGLEHATIYFYEIKNGEKTLVGYGATGPGGHANARVHVTPGSIHRYVARWVKMRNYRFKASNPNVPSRSRYSNVVRYHVPRSVPTS